MAGRLNWTWNLARNSAWNSAWRWGVVAIALLAPPLAQPAGAQAPPGVVRPELELGSQGTTVQEIQAVLKLLGFYRGSVDGVFSQDFSLAVAQFQQAAGLPGTGRVTVAMWERLFPPTAVATQLPLTTNPVSNRPITPIGSLTASAPQPVPPAIAQPVPQPEAPPEFQDIRPEAEFAPQPDPLDPYPILRVGAQGDAVMRLQEKLQALGVFEGSVDGDFGPMTETAVMAAQAQLGLEPDGVVGPATWDALGR